MGSPKRKSLCLADAAGAFPSKPAPPDSPPCAVSPANGAPAAPSAAGFVCGAPLDESMGWPAAPTSPAIRVFAASAA
jgi:hypothetical protein